jgi:hypothetical protein
MPEDSAGYSRFLCPRDELIGDVVQVVADNVRLRANPQTSLPARVINAASQPAATAPTCPMYGTR